MGWGQAWGGTGRKENWPPSSTYHTIFPKFSLQHATYWLAIYCTQRVPGLTGQVSEKMKNPNQKMRRVGSETVGLGYSWRSCPLKPSKKERNWSRRKRHTYTRAERQMKILPMEIVKRETWVKERDCLRGRRITQRRRGQDTVGFGNRWRRSWPLKS
jgi:hypothetical protein